MPTYSSSVWGRLQPARDFSPAVQNQKTVSNTRHTIDVVAFARDRLAFEPDLDQARALDPFIRRGLLNCCRQWGKSTTVAIRAVHQALHRPG